MKKVKIFALSYTIGYIINCFLLSHKLLQFLFQLFTITKIVIFIFIFLNLILKYLFHQAGGGGAITKMSWGILNLIFNIYIYIYICIYKTINSIKRRLPRCNFLCFRFLRFPFTSLFPT